MNPLAWWLVSALVIGGAAYKYRQQSQERQAIINTQHQLITAQRQAIAQPARQANRQAPKQSGDTSSQSSDDVDLIFPEGDIRTRFPGQDISNIAGNINAPSYAGGLQLTPGGFDSKGASPGFFPGPLDLSVPGGFGSAPLLPAPGPSSGGTGPIPWQGILGHR